MWKFIRLSGAALLLAMVANVAAAQQKTGPIATSRLPSLPEGLEVVAVLNQPPGNVAVTPEGRIILSQHQWYDPQYRVVELKDGKTVPFPNEDWAARPTGPSDQGLIAVLGVRSDPNGVVWMLDNARQGTKVIGTPKLVGWDTRANKLFKVIEFEKGVYLEDSFLNDLAIDPQRGKIYVSDPAGGDNAALVVVDIESGKSRRVLQGHASVTPEKIPLTIDGQVIIGEVDGQMRNSFIGVDPITIDPSNEYVYYGPFNSKTTYRIPADALADGSLKPDQLAQLPKAYAERPLSDGEIIDSAGNLYITDIGHDAIGVATPGGYRVLFQDDQAISWPDGFAAGPDNKIYVTVNRLHESPFLDPKKPNQDDKATDQPKQPTYLLRFDALAPIPVGR